MRTNSIWLRVLRHLAKRSRIYKLTVLLTGFMLLFISIYISDDFGTGVAAIGTAILASVFSSFLLQVFPADALDSRVRFAGIVDIYYPTRIFEVEDWFEKLEGAARQVDLTGRSLFKWIDSDGKKERFAEIVRRKTARKIKFRILVMSPDNSFLAALEEKKEPLYKLLIPKLEKVERYLLDLARDLPERQKEFLEVRRNYALPFYRSISRFDSSMYVIPYFDDKETGECPMYELRGDNTPLFRLYAYTFESSWEDDRSRSLFGSTGDTAKPRKLGDLLVHSQQSKHFSTMVNIREKSLYVFDDFEPGWKCLFERMTDLEPEDRILYDYTLASVANAKLMGYPFAGYPGIVALRAKECQFSIRMILGCDTTDRDCLRQSEQYIYDFLRYVYNGNGSFGEMLAIAKEDEKSRFRFAIIPLERVRERWRAPFNIYGNFAISRSLINDPSVTPRLEATWDRKIVGEYLAEFHRIWGEYSDTQDLFREAEHVTGENISRIDMAGYNARQ